MPSTIPQPAFPVTEGEGGPVPTSCRAAQNADYECLLIEWVFLSAAAHNSVL
jgi:hypothetical protein